MATGVALALVILLGTGWEIGAEIYTWTDEQGIVHMTDQWDNVPAAMRSRVMVRESTVRPDPGPSPSSPPRSEAQPPDIPAPRPQPLQMPPDLPEAPPVTSAPSPPPDYRVLVPSHRPFVQRSRRPDRPFPYNVQLDPDDPDFVWVGPNRVPKDTFTYPKIPLDKQGQFRERIRQLEQRRAPPRGELRSPDR